MYVSFQVNESPTTNWIMYTSYPTSNFIDARSVSVGKNVWSVSTLKHVFLATHYF